MKVFIVLSALYFVLQVNSLAIPSQKTTEPETNDENLARDKRGCGKKSLKK